MNPLVLPLAFLIGAIIHGVADAAVSADSASIGKEFAHDRTLNDPTLRITERVLSGLESGSRAVTVRRAEPAVRAGTDLEALRKDVGPAVVLDFETLSWGIHVHPDDGNAYVVDLSARSRVLRLADASVLWTGVCHAPWGDGRRPTPTLGQLTAEGGALLRRRLDEAEDACADNLLAALLGQAQNPKPRTDLWAEVRRRPSRDVQISPATLADVEALVAGDAGAVQGTQHFDAEFDGMALRAEDAWRLRTLTRDAMDAPWGSGLMCNGTIDGVPFKLKMEKHKAGRVGVTLEGFVFDGESEARAFVAPFVGAEGLRKLELEGFAGGRAIGITINPGGGAGDLVLVDRGAAIPVRLPDMVTLDDALKVHVSPATLAAARTMILGEPGLVPRGQRFQAEFEDFALTVDDVEPLADLLRAALRAHPRSKLELDGTFADGRFNATLTVDRRGHGRLELAGFVFASAPDLDRFLARIEGADGLNELTFTGTVAGQKYRHSWQAGQTAPGA